MDALNKILALLPFNGDKTKIGSLVAIITMIQAVLADPNTSLFIQSIIAAGTLGIGLFHKYVKSNAEVTK